MAFVNLSQRILSQSKSETKSIGPGEYLDYDNDLNIIEKNQQIHAPFNSQASRITAEIPYDQRIRDIGPGSYDSQPTIIKKSFSTKNSESNNLINQTMFKLHEKTKQMKENNWKKIKDNLRISHIERTERDKKETQISKANKNKLYVQLNSISNRVCSIPSKNNFGYDFDKNENKFFIEDPSKILRYSGEKSDSVSPNEYFVEDKDQEKKKIRGVDWSRSSSKITQGNTNRNATLHNNNVTINNNETTPFSEQTTKDYEYNKDRSFRFYQNVKNPARGLKKVHSTEDIIIGEILKNAPGPGYYFNEDYKGNKAKKIVNSQYAYGPKAERVILLSNNYNNPNLGPGSYNKTKYTPKSVNYYPFVRKENNIVPINPLKTNPYLGPGSYNPKNLSKKTMSLYYGSLDRRFKYYLKDENSRPGPGEYIEMPVWDRKEYNIPISYKEQKIVEYAKSEVPGIGKYHPDIVSSIDYKIKSKENKLQSFVAPFSSGEERFVSLQQIKNIPGPGYYHKDPKIKLKKKLPRTTTENYPIKNTNEDESGIGPGSYEPDNYHHWNKKSFNVLFV